VGVGQAYSIGRAAGVMAAMENRSLLWSAPLAVEIHSQNQVSFPCYGIPSYVIGAMSSKIF